MHTAIFLLRSVFLNGSLFTFKYITIYYILFFFFLIFQFVVHLWEREHHNISAYTTAIKIIFSSLDLTWRERARGKKIENGYYHRQCSLKSFFSTSCHLIYWQWEMSCKCEIVWLIGKNRRRAHTYTHTEWCTYTRTFTNTFTFQIKPKRVRLVNCLLKYIRYSHRKSSTWIRFSKLTKKNVWSHRNKI